MQRSGLIRVAAIVAVAGWGLGGLGSVADAQERVRWKLASSYTSSLDVLGQNILRVVENVETMSDGNFQFEFNEPGALVPALEVFDASLDRSLGFYEDAKHNYFPGWHQRASLVELIMNRNAWDGLPASYQKIVEIACNEAHLWLMGAAEASRGEAIAFHESEGVAIHRWPPEFIAAFRQAWQEVAQEESAADPRFKEVYDHYSEFREHTPSGARSAI